MAADDDVARVGDRVEEILAGLRSTTSPRTVAAAEELVGLVVELYGEGLARVVTVLRDSGSAGADALDRLAADPLVESLLLLHGLHPVDVDTRIQQALDRVRPYLGSHAGGVEYLGVDDQGVARLRLEGSCHGCPSSTVTVSLAIETAVKEAAPEVDDVVVEGMTDPGPKLLQIGRPPSESAGKRWTSLGPLNPPYGRVITTTARSTEIAVCRVAGNLYAYLDACPSCDSSLRDAELDGAELRCPGCGSSYDVQHAGQGPEGSGRHLDPVPLLADANGVRVALAADLVAS
jgi:Fe-S cluster biogenesis protein NfuA/nitrite reductase/ring-hydroxylating ferredoxin subunit